jgi:glycogen operon protein
MIDWAPDWAHSVTLFLDGEAIAFPDAEGQPVFGDSFLLLFNGYWDGLRFTIPPTLSGSWMPALATETADGRLESESLAPGSTIERPGRSLLALHRAG